MTDYDTWQSPLSGRYASKEMLQLFSPRTRASKWRKLWVWLAEAEKELGLDISDKAIEQMRANVRMSDHDFEIAAVEEKRRYLDTFAEKYHLLIIADPNSSFFRRHDVMVCKPSQQYGLSFCASSKMDFRPMYMPLVKLRQMRQE